jgi:hypothetical protein
MVTLVLIFSRMKAVSRGTNKNNSRNTCPSRALVAHIYNPSYSGGKDQEDHSLKPAWANNSQDSISKNPIKKNWAGGMAQSEGLSSSPQTAKRKKRNKERKRNACPSSQFLAAGQMGDSRVVLFVFLPLQLCP